MTIAPRRPRRAGAVVSFVPAVFAGAILAAAAGCADLDIALDAAFPASVPGLPADAAWVSLPLGAWVVDGGIRAQAISACFARSCPEPAGVGLFTATGRAADRLAALAARPGELARDLDARRRRGKASSSISVAPARIGPLRGTAIQLARTDGTRSVYGLVLGSRRSDTETLLIVVASREDVTQRLAHEVAAQIE